ncbi:hypothetical protein THAOC_03272 [Thalassiosira oceanica]|uniref:Uncharacterized protein n=1 Tax=Thalassiosira oceanica TaxID=159749 RepID=K0TCY0_THAOC|nr:hypothetical protein THAOC_03272 [Thalassiosira oceanica]|eukprot:EJK75019.1 hypothetical protein THAOC_03272 [Thalassiosira oceanica]
MDVSMAVAVAFGKREEGMVLEVFNERVLTVVLVALVDLLWLDPVRKLQYIASNLTSKRANLFRPIAFLDVIGGWKRLRNLEKPEIGSQRFRGFSSFSLKLVRGFSSRRETAKREEAGKNPPKPASREARKPAAPVSGFSYLRPGLLPGAGLRLRELRVYNRDCKLRSYKFARCKLSKLSPKFAPRFLIAD